MEKFEKVTGKVVLEKVEDGYFIHDNACFICGSLGINEDKVLDMINRLNNYDILEQENAILRKHFSDLITKILAEFDKDGWCRLVIEKKK